MKTERQVVLEDAYNFRDIGGYQTMEGKRVKRGLLYRSDELCYCTKNDVHTLKKLGLRSIIDYRSQREREGKEDILIENVKIYHLDPKADAAALASAGLTELGEQGHGALTSAAAKKLMIEQNRQFVLSESSKSAYQKMFKLILDKKKLPLVQHCRGGKDRTGYGVALILLLLGIDQDTVLQDYMDTNLCKYEKNLKSLQAVSEMLNREDFVQALRYLKEAKEEFLLTALNEISKQYGTVQEYAMQELGMTKEKQKALKDIFLEKG